MILRPLHVLALMAGLAAGCAREKAVTSKSVPVVQPSVGLQQRFGDEIVVAGRLYRTGTPVVTWMDPGGFDAYRTERRFSKFDESSFEATTQAIERMKAEKTRYRPDIDAPARLNLRYGNESGPAATQRAATRPVTYDSPTTRPLTPEQLEQVRGGGWPLDLLQQKVDQFVLHYDVAGTSRNCFYVLHDDRGLSVHFMLDLDGTVYQTADLKERTWHATKANSRSIGVEIANMGSYSMRESAAPLEAWYKRDERGQTYINIPERLGGMASQRTNPSVLRPARNEIVVGEIRGVKQRQYYLTPQQYAALIKLTAALCDVFPLIECDYPRDADGQPLMRTLTDAEYNVYGGVLGHFHVQDNKSDPGPALQWEYVIDGAKNELAKRRKTSVATK